MAFEFNWDVALAFALVIAAGLSTTVGASFALCARIADTRFLAISLGVSSGVMIYVSFAEIFLVKSVDDFAKQGYNDIESMRYATLCFFGGVMIMAVISSVIHLICQQSCNREQSSNQASNNYSQSPNNRRDDLPVDIETGPTSSMSKADACTLEIRTRDTDHNEGQKRLTRVGLMSGVAIALHNFPEGLATFVSTLSDPTAGVAIAIAIALHNIPEGVVVAMPVYYATRSRTRGFFWAFLSGLSEPVGALFGWIILSNIGDLAYAMMFAIVAGMMVFISVRELIPTALRFDPEDKYVSISVFIGMAIMAASLLLFSA